jgi:predicted metal-binding protein
MTEPHHITTTDLNRYRLNVITGLELAMMEEHLLWCRQCFERTQENFESGESSCGHISVDEMELYHRRQLADEGREAVITSHVSRCQDCADRMLAVQRFLYKEKLKSLE